MNIILLTVLGCKSQVCAGQRRGDLVDTINEKFSVTDVHLKLPSDKGSHCRFGRLYLT